jgi:hypothetical protein
MGHYNISLMVSKNFFNIKINVLHNRAILYFMLFLSIVNLISYGLVRDYYTPMIFILVGIITSFFTKNMTVVLSIALVACNVLKQGSKVGLYEGMDTNNPEDETVSAPEFRLPDISEKPDLVKYEAKYKELLALQEKVLNNLSELEVLKTRLFQLLMKRS